MERKKNQKLQRKQSENPKLCTTREGEILYTNGMVFEERSEEE